jgi:hypothetical protein
MPSQEYSFTCVIEDHVLHDRFSADVVVKKKLPIRTSLQDGKIDLADIFIEPVSDQRPERVHNHFVLYDYTGHGLYIVRNQDNSERRRRTCTIWDLGHVFALKVMEALKQFA